MGSLITITAFLLACSNGAKDSAGGGDADADTDADGDTDTDSDTDTDTDTDVEPDADEDGYADDVDCDDDNAAINPGATETCGNGVDDNCNGTPDGCEWSGEHELEGTEIYDMEPNAAAATEVTVCDVNGDDRLDVILGAQLAALPFNDSGAVYAFFGPVSADDHTEATSWTLAGGVEDAYTGVAVECGDVDGDGRDDLVVGAPGAADGGVVYLVPGGGIGSVPILDEAAGVWFAENKDDQLGVDAVMLDSNGDGLADFAAANGSATSVATYLWLGPVSGTDTAAAADAHISGSAADSLYAVIGSAGDLDGDGHDELLVQGSEAKGSTNPALFVFEGPLAGEISKSDADLRIEDGEPGFATSSAGIGHDDLNGDGLDDLIASNPKHDGGKGVTYIIRGEITGDTSTAIADAMIYGTAPEQSVGCAIAGPGDVDGDGIVDLALTACTDSSGGTYGGAAFLFYGPFAGTMDVDAGPRGKLYGGTPGGVAGWELAAGDVTGDAILDLIVGVPGDVGGKAIIVPSWNL